MIKEFLETLEEFDHTDKDVMLLDLLKKIQLKYLIK